MRRLAVAAAVLLLAACSTDHPSSQPAAADIASASRSQLRDGGTLRWALDTVPATLNVYQPEATADSVLLAQALLPSLFRLDEHAHPTPDGDYLTAADAAPDGLAVTYRLNPAAVWSDGSPLTAADFTAQWHALSGADQAFHGEHPAGYAAISAVAQGSDPHQVKVTFKQPYAGWRSLFAPLYPAAVTSTPAAFNQPLTAPKAVAGPFTVAAYDAAHGKVSLARNPRWWGDQAKAAAIDFLVTPSAARLDALEGGKLDIAALTTTVDRAVPGGTGTAGGAAAAPPDAAALAQASAQALKRAEALPGLTLHRAPATALTQLTLNAARGPLTDTTVRRALAQAVDRRQAAAAALGPLGLPGTALGSHLLLAGQEGYQDNSASAGAETPAVLLDRAGWKTEGQTRRKDGKELTLSLLLPDGSVTASRTADAIAADLAAVGVTLRLTPVPFDAFVKDHLATGDYDLALFSWPGAADPAGEERARYAKPQPGPDGLPLVGRNYARTGTEEIDQLFDRATTTLDPAAHLALLQQADARIWQLAHSVPLYQRPDLVAVRSTVSNAGAFGFTTPRFQDIGFRT